MSTATITRPSEVLFKAADLLDVTGWCRGTATDTKGRHCALGAIRSVDRFGQAGTEAYDALWTAVAGRSVARWNDKQRDKRKVQRLMRRTARNLAAIGK